jgi:hypothetical protein
MIRRHKCIVRDAKETPHTATTLGTVYIDAWYALKSIINYPTCPVWIARKMITN